MRVCDVGDCRTILSAYNATAACWVHREPTYRRSEFRNEVSPRS